MSICMMGFAQKQKVTIEKETGVILADGVPYAKMIKENAPGQLGVNKNFTITNLEGKELLYFVFTQEDERVRGYKTGKVLTFYTLNFIESGESGVRPGTFRSSGVAKMVVKNKLIKDGEIDEAAAKKFLLKY